jgi:ammonium transporter, Amt family
VVVGWSLAMGFLVFWILKKTMGIRVSREEEVTGLDVSEHGAQAYPPDTTLPMGAGAAD